MNGIESKEVSEGLKPAKELSSLETPQARELLESTESALTSGFEKLSSPEKLAQFGNLESKCAEIEGRNPRTVESAKLKEAVFQSDAESVKIDNAELGEMKSLSLDKLSELKRKIFSTFEGKLNRGEKVTFGRLSVCDKKCVKCDVTSGSCNYN